LGKVELEAVLELVACHNKLFPLTEWNSTRPKVNVCFELLQWAKKGPLVAATAGAKPRKTLKGVPLFF